MRDRLTELGAAITVALVVVITFFAAFTAINKIGRKGAVYAVYEESSRDARAVFSSQSRAEEYAGAYEKTSWYKWRVAAVTVDDQSVPELVPLYWYVACSEEPPKRRPRITAKRPTHAVAGRDAERFTVGYYTNSGKSKPWYRIEVRSLKDDAWLIGVSLQYLLETEPPFPVGQTSFTRDEVMELIKKGRK